MKVDHDIETLFKSWKKWKVTLFGKCTVIHCLPLTMLIYTATNSGTPDEEFINDVGSFYKRC